MTVWDMLLIGFVSAQALAASYLYDPKWKALVFGLPFPFTFAYLAVGSQANVLNVLSLSLMYLFMQAVRLLYVRFRVPIVLAIVASAAGYVLVSLALVSLVPVREAYFWFGGAAAFAAAIALLIAMPVRDEPGDRTKLPPWLKFPLTFALVTLLVLGKQSLQGFVTFFPMVGVFVAYEARRSLWTMARQNAVVMVTVLPMLAVMHLSYDRLGAPGTAVAGWGVYLVSFWIYRWSMRKTDASKRKEQPSDEHARIPVGPHR